jgi:hypothetical protein
MTSTAVGPSHVLPAVLQAGPPEAANASGKRVVCLERLLFRVAHLTTLRRGLPPLEGRERPKQDPRLHVQA